MALKILCVGDVVGMAGTRCLREKLPAKRRELGVDVCIVNGENSADGNGILPATAGMIFEAGADVITGGNHSFRRREIFPQLEEEGILLRLANASRLLPGTGVCTVDRGRYQVTVVNLIGQVYMDAADSPFDALDAALHAAGDPRLCVVDFHAEATAEKKALGYYADGRVSAFFGTHTHVMTADEQILPCGTGFITDIGMTGPTQSVLGVRPEQSIERIRTGVSCRFAVADGPCAVNAVLFTVDETTGHTVGVERLIF